MLKSVYFRQSLDWHDCSLSRRESKRGSRRLLLYVVDPHTQSATGPFPSAYFRTKARSKGFMSKIKRAFNSKKGCEQNNNNNNNNKMETQYTILKSNKFSILSYKKWQVANKLLDFHSPIAPLLQKTTSPKRTIIWLHVITNLLQYHKNVLSLSVLFLLYLLGLSLGL